MSTANQPVNINNNILVYNNIIIFSIGIQTEMKTKARNDTEWAVCEQQYEMDVFYNW